MTTETITERFDITWSAADRVGRDYVCDVIVVDRETNEVAGRYQGEGSTATKAENIARAKAKQAIYDGIGGRNSRLAAAPAQAPAPASSPIPREVPAAPGGQISVVVKSVPSLSVAFVVEHFRVSKAGGVLQAAAVRADFDLRTPADERAAEFLAAMEHVGVATLERFDELVEQYAAELRRFFERITDLIRIGKRGKQVAAYSFLGELVLLLAFPDRFDVTYLTDAGWHADVVELVMRAARETRG